MNETAGRSAKEENRASPMRGRLIRGVGGFYTVRDEAGKDYTVRAPKKFRREGKTPLAGDEVLFSPGHGETQGWLEEILPRKTLCLRPPVANVSLLLIVVAPVPEVDLLLLDRQISRAFSQGMKVVIAVNKADLGGELADQLRREYAGAGIPVFAVSALEGTGLEPLKAALLAGGLCCAAGQSGTGKSTLLGALMEIKLETGEISRRIGRGKNTTRHAEVMEQNGLRMVDTAGFNLLEAERALPPEKLKDRYPEFAEYEGRCRFRECLHDAEPGCAVREAAEKGLLSPERLFRYRQLLAETKEVWRERYD